jgi:hypothetical protein
MRTFFSGLATLGEAMMLALAVPIAILAVGTPLVLVVRLALEIAQVR